MHYRHSFHAGNFADVFKHVVLCALIQALNRKDSPWLYLDTHAGAGFYELGQGETERTAEWRDGVGRLIAQRRNLPQPLLSYLDASVTQTAPTAQQSIGYRGSPLIAARLARPQDRLALFENQAAVADSLQQQMTLRGGPVGYAVHLRDGYESYTVLPPRERRGLVLIDPPYERADEFDAIADYLEKAGARFANGIYAVWYPHKRGYEVGRFLRRVERKLARPTLNLRFETGAAAQGQMHGCGLLIVNPPYRLLEPLTPAFSRLSTVLAQGPAAQWSSDWIRPEKPA